MKREYDGVCDELVEGVKQQHIDLGLYNFFFLQLICNILKSHQYTRFCYCDSDIICLKPKKNETAKAELPEYAHYLFILINQLQTSLFWVDHNMRRCGTQDLRYFLKKDDAQNFSRVHGNLPMWSIDKYNRFFFLFFCFN